MCIHRTFYINGLKYGRYTKYSDGEKTGSVAYKNGWKDGKEKNYSKIRPVIDWFIIANYWIKGIYDKSEL